MINPESDKSPLAHSNHFPCITALTHGKDKMGGGGVGGAKLPRCVRLLFMAAQHPKGSRLHFLIYTYRCAVLSTVTRSVPYGLGDGERKT